MESPLPKSDAAVTEPTAHTLTLLFHRFLSQNEWRDVIEAVQRYVPYIQKLRAEAVYEPPEPPRCPRCGSYQWVYKGDRAVCADCGR